MKRVSVWRLMPLMMLSVVVLLTGCADFSKFSDGPVEVSVLVTDANGNPVNQGFVTLIGPTSTYGATIGAGGVVNFGLMEPGNYEIIAYAPNGLTAAFDAPVWGGKPATFTAILREAHNLVLNPVFAEVDGDDMAKNWHTPTWGGKADFWVDDSGRGPFGENVAVVHTPEGVDGGWGQHIPVERNTTYRLSGWVRAENFSRDTGFGGQYSVDEIGQSSLTPSVEGDEWVYVTNVINSGNRDSLRILTLVGGWGTSSGTFYFTGVSLVRL